MKNLRAWQTYAQAGMPPINKNADGVTEPASAICHVFMIDESQRAEYEENDFEVGSPDQFKDVLSDLANSEDPYYIGIKEAKEMADDDEIEIAEIAAVMSRQKASREIIAKISVKMTRANISADERMALGPLIVGVSTLLHDGSFEDALGTINAQESLGLTEEASLALGQAVAIIEEAITKYY